jgi:hypothetical protein
MLDMNRLRPLSQGQIENRVLGQTATPQGDQDVYDVTALLSGHDPWVERYWCAIRNDVEATYLFLED